MSSSSSPRGFGGAPRQRSIRGSSFRTALSPLDIEIPVPAAPLDPAAARAQAQQGYDDGYQAGVAEGLAAGRAAAAAETAGIIARAEALCRSLAEAADDLRRRQALELIGLEDTLARAAFDLATAVVGRELQLSSSPGNDALARALALVPAGCIATARLHPDDVASLEAVSDPVSVIADPAVEPGGCILEVGHSRIDAQLGSALDRVRAALLGDR
ncbi:MAG TPA: FliH/SctL family protein [Acidimicrobiia bacterium]